MTKRIVIPADYWRRTVVHECGEAFATFVLIALYSMDQGHPGSIADEELKFACFGVKDPLAHADILVEQGLLERLENGWSINGMEFPKDD